MCPQAAVKVYPDCRRQDMEHSVRRDTRTSISWVVMAKLLQCKSTGIFAGSLACWEVQQLAPPLKILKHALDETCYLSLGAKTWAALMWPVVEREDPSTMEKYFVLKAECPDGDRVKVCWVHLYEPQYWEVLETEAVHWNGIICLRLCSGAPQPLLFWMLLHPK